MDTNNKEKFYPWLQRNSTWIFVSLIIIAFISPWFFTRSWSGIDFSGTGEIGDTIGGLTAPFINLLSAVLIYLTFKEQIEANNLTKKNFVKQEVKEQKRLETIKALVLWDLEHRIKPNAKEIKEEIEIYIPNIKAGQGIPLVDHVDFNSDFYKVNSLNDYFEIFNKEPKDLQSLTNFYNRVEFIYDNSPNNSYNNLREERLAASRITFQDQASRIAHHDNINEKHTKTMQALIKNIDNLRAQIDTFVAKYS